MKRRFLSLGLLLLFLVVPGLALGQDLAPAKLAMAIHAGRTDIGEAAWMLDARSPHRVCDMTLERLESLVLYNLDADYRARVLSLGGGTGFVYYDISSDRVFDEKILLAPCQ